MRSLRHLVTNFRVTLAFAGQATPNSDACVEPSASLDRGLASVGQRLDRPRDGRAGARLSDGASRFSVGARPREEIAPKRSSRSRRAATAVLLVSIATTAASSVACGRLGGDGTADRDSSPIPACEDLIAKSELCAEALSPPGATAERDIARDMRAAIYGEAARGPTAREDMRARCEANLPLVQASCRRSLSTGSATR